jgi:glycosyltransferase involved in cell wall biosynthesis
MTGRPLRVAHVTATFPPYFGGTGNVCYHNARLLAERGHDVRVYTVAWPGKPDDPPGVMVLRMQTKVRIGNAALLLGLIRELKACDVVHLHYPFIGSGELATVITRLRRIPLFVTYHNDLHAPGLRGALFAVYCRVIAPRILATAARVGVVSSGYAASSTLLGPLVHAGDPRLLEIPNGVDITRFRPDVDGARIRQAHGIPSEAFVVAFSGVLDAAHHFKRLDLLLRAIPGVDSTPVWLLVVGGGDLLPSYQQMAVQLEIDERVRFVGKVFHADVPSYLAAADVLVLPSDAVESFGLVVIEAMACGRPVIATDLPGVRDVVANGRDGLLVPPGEVAALSRAIDEIAGMSLDDRRAMGAAGREKVAARYEWHQIGEQLESIYKCVVDDASDRSVDTVDDQRPVKLPLEVRAALDLAAVRSGGLDGAIRGRVIGQPGLAAELARYAPVIDEPPSRVISLGFDSAELRNVVATTAPHDVVSVVTGPLGRIFQPLRSRTGVQATIAAADLSRTEWRELGYERVGEDSVQGLGSLAWAVGERAARRINRSELADRCRIAMLRCLIAVGPLALTTVRVRQYRRVRR